MKKLDSLGDRMKSYENVTRNYLMRRSYVMIRIDGCHFHTYTRGLQRPFDIGLIEDMDETAKYLCQKIQGAKLAFVQSDEISILLTDFEDVKTSAWFDNNIQKMCSVAASIATAKFNQLRMLRYDLINKDEIHNFKLAEFDARVFQLPTKQEVCNYLIWRQQDTTRNSISSVAQSMFSPSELHGKKCDDMQEMMFQKGTNWNDFDVKLKRGRLIMKQTFLVETDHIGRLIMKQTFLVETDHIGVNVTRTKWESIGPEIFTSDDGRSFLNDLIPSRSTQY